MPKIKTKIVTMRWRRQEACPIIVGRGLAAELLRVVRRERNCSRLVVITDSEVAKLWGKPALTALKKSGLPVELLEFAAGELSKNQNTVTRLQRQLLKKRYGRDTLILALGGGVVGDIVGYVAASFMRGVPYVQIPTTLLAMVDSSIGGKVGIDTPYGKNTVGAFHQPRAIIMDLAFLEKLPRTQFIFGLFEAIKTFFTSDRAGLADVDRLNLDHPLNAVAALQRVVWRSAGIKAGVVTRDEREENERRIVNFGHTIGHALEKLSGYTMPHGFAVGFGMLAEVKIAELLGILSARDADFVFDYLEKFGVTTKIFKQFRMQDIITDTYGDKKVRGGKPYYVLLKKIGAVYTKNGQFAHPVNDAVVKKVLMQLGCRK